MLPRWAALTRHDLAAKGLKDLEHISMSGVLVLTRTPGDKFVSEEEGRFAGDVKIKLRAHHILCVHGFRGLGYSESFVANMERVIAALKAPGASVMIVEIADDICAMCPHCERDKCMRDLTSRETSINALDQSVAALLNLTTGAVYSAQDLLSDVVSLVDEDWLGEVCGECEWFESGYCLDGIKAGLLSVKPR